MTMSTGQFLVALINMQAPAGMCLHACLHLQHADDCLLFSYEPYPASVLASDTHLQIAGTMVMTACAAAKSLGAPAQVVSCRSLVSRSIFTCMH